MTPVREALEPQYQQFRRTAIAEMTPWVEGFDMSRVSVSAPDKEAGSPKPGDMIARNPKNHDDKWLVAAAYFADNFAAASAPSGAHFTDADLDALFEASKRDAHFVGSEIRQLIGDIRTARAAVAPGEPCAWHQPGDVPLIELGSSRQYIIAVYRKHSGKVYTFAAEYLNAYPLRFDWGCPKDKEGTCAGCEDGCPTTGWFVTEGADDDGYTYHGLSLSDGDRLEGWREIPRWEDHTTPQPATGWDEAAKLPCDVHLPPATYINAGCDVSTLLTAIKLRETWPEEDRKFRREAPAPAERVSDDELRTLARLAWNNWPDNEQSRRELVNAEAKDDVSRTSWDRVVAAILTATRAAPQLDASHNNGERLLNSDAAERGVARSDTAEAPAPDREWAEMRGYILPTDGTNTINPAPSEARLQIKTLLDETGSRDLEDLKDMAMVGHATMAAIAVVIESDGPLKDWSPAQCPSEIITDMFNMLGDIASAEARLREASATVENLIRRDPACFNLSDELQSVRAALREALTAPGRSEAKESEGGVPPFGGYGSAEAAVAAADGSAQTCHETFKALRKIIDVAYDALAMTWDQSGMPGPSDPTAAERREIVARPRVNDNDSGEITVTLEGKELRGWSYTNDQERRTKMLCAREFVEGFCTGREA